MKDKDSQLIFEAYLGEDMTSSEKARLHGAGMMPKIDAMEYAGYEADLENITGVGPHEDWYDHGGYDSLGDPDDNLEDEHVAVVMMTGEGVARALFVDLTDMGVYHGLTGGSFAEQPTEMGTEELDRFKRDMVQDSKIMKSLKDMAMYAEIPPRDSDEEHYKRGVSPGEFM